MGNTRGTGGCRPREGGDPYKFETLADSGLSKATRDTIQGFDDGFDKIDVSDIGGSSFAGVNTAFTGAGSVRVVINGTGWIVEGDIGGDGKADFSIAVLDAEHDITWTSADFVLVA